MTREFSRVEKLDFMRSLMWDYDIPPEHCLEVLEGKRELAGHYNEKTLFKKMIESFRWFTVLKLMPLNRIYELLTDDLYRYGICNSPINCPITATLSARLPLCCCGQA